MPFEVAKGEKNIKANHWSVPWVMPSLINHICTMKFLKQKLGKVTKIKHARARTVPNMCFCSFKKLPFTNYSYMLNMLSESTIKLEHSASTFYCPNNNPRFVLFILFVCVFWRRLKTCAINVQCDVFYFLERQQRHAALWMLCAS